MRHYRRIMMSACIFFASDAPLPEVFPPPEYGYLAINVDDGTIGDGGADDNFALRTYPDSFLYTDKAFAVSPAIVSAFVFSIFPCPSCVNGAITGTTPLYIKSDNREASTFSTSPTKP